MMKKRRQREEKVESRANKERGIFYVSILWFKIVSGAVI